MNLPKGTSVLPNKETEYLLKGFFLGYANGTGRLSNAWNNTKKAASKIILLGHSTLVLRVFLLFSQKR
ncbi:hypothetical protein [Cytobacillus oceanisediminis]|uniref:hypothetical protein n=1 Tax=Cytobacillus oceanisediminis TaxID=665099 RepID=UPI0037351164